MVAYSYAARFPREVKKLALLETPIPDIWEKVHTTPALWHFHFVNSFRLRMISVEGGRERTFLEHFWQTLSPHSETFSEADRQRLTHRKAPYGRHLKCSNPSARCVLPLALLILLIVSYVIRPASRRLGVLPTGPALG